jgi:hypothetical protein
VAEQGVPPEEPALSGEEAATAGDEPGPCGSEPRPSGDEPGPSGAEQPTAEDELRRALDELRVADVLLQSLTLSTSLAYGRLGPESRDLGQVRLAIEALRALEPVLREGGVDEAIVRDLEQARANLQLAYASAVGEPRDA